jgi:hypothetical protein
MRFPFVPFPTVKNPYHVPFLAWKTEPVRYVRLRVCPDVKMRAMSSFLDIFAGFGRQT